MAVFSVTTNTNFDDASMLPMVNGDTITITNGAVLTINSDPQTGKNAAYLSGIAVTQGEVFIDGTKTRQFNYVTASVLPIIGDIATCTATGASGEVIAITGTTTSGTIKLRNITGGTGVFSATAITFTSSKTATASTVDIVSWLLICGMETASVALASRQSTVRMLGAWYSIGTSNGAASQTFQHYTIDALPAIWVETGSGTNVYEIWLNAGGRWAAGLSNGERGKFFSMTDGNATISFSTTTVVTTIPINGARIRVPNIHLTSVASGALTSTTRSTNATLATRYKITNTGAGVIIMDKVVAAGFYLNSVASYSINVTNSGFLHSVAVSNTLMTTTLDGVGVGMTGTTSYPALTLSGCVSALTNIANSTFSNYLALTTGTVSFTNMNNATFTNSLIFAFARAASNVDALLISGCENVNVTAGCFMVGARLHITSSDDVIISNLVVSDMVSGANVTTFPLTSVVFDTGCDTMKLDGLKISATGTVPYTSLVSCGNTINLKIRNIGTVAAPILGAAQIGYVVEMPQTVLVADVSRVYATGMRLGALNYSAGNNGTTTQNIISDNTLPFKQPNNSSITKGCRISNGVLGVGTANVFTNSNVVGNHFYDLFTADTTGIIGIFFNEVSSDPLSISSYSITAGTPVFDGKGTLLLRTLGDQVEYTWAYSILGYTAFANLAFSFVGTTVTNITYEYKLDRNIGTFDATWKSLSAATLSAEVISTAGFRIKIRFTANATLTTSSIGGFTLPMVTTLVAQNAAVYPIDTVATALSLVNLKAGSEVKVYRLSDSLELAAIDSSSTTFTYSYVWSVDVPVYIIILNVQYNYLRLDSIILGAAGVSIRVLQQFDNFYT